VKRWCLAIAGIALFCSQAPGYYHFVHYLAAAGWQAPVFDKFDLAALNAKTVQYFVADDGPDKLADGDSFTGLVSQIHLATKPWNEVPTSDLRIVFGGFVKPGTVQDSPAIDVIFDDDIPPGLIAFGGPTSLGKDFVTRDKVTFAPIAHSTVRIHRNLSNFPSYGEDLFLSIVHEFGHALGLQHTLTSAVMSTSITRGTTKARPLNVDDMVGVSILYPTAAFLKQNATISGQVTMNSSGVNMASVVAISAAGPAISTLTNPDGSYTLRGIPPGMGYYVYVHPLPPPLSVETTPANIVPPKDDSGNVIPATRYFDSQFYPGTRDPSQATLFSLKAGDLQDAVDFTVNGRAAPGISSVTTYGYWGQNAVHPDPLVDGTKGTTMVATGFGLLSSTGTSVAPGLAISTLGSDANILPNTTSYYTDSYIKFGIAPVSKDAMGLRHLFFTTPNDMYVLPSAFLMVKNAPPSIDSVKAGDPDANGNATALIAGSNMDLSSAVYFDGVPARILGQDKHGVLSVSVPVAPAKYTANVTVLNTDLQSSLFVQPTPQTFTYPDAKPPAPSLIAPQLPAGSEAMVEIRGMPVIDGEVTIGFGSSDVLVGKVWLRDGGRIWLNLSVDPAAANGDLPITISSGLNTVYTQSALHVTDPVDGQLVLDPSLTNAATNRSSVWPGAVAIANIPNIEAPASTLRLAFGGEAAVVYWASKGRMAFRVPADLKPGPVVMSLSTAQNNLVLPVVVDIDPIPPMILAAMIAPSQNVDSTHTVKAGSTVLFAITNMGDLSGVSDPSVIHFSIGGEDHAATEITQTAANGKPLPYTLISVVLASDVQTGSTVPVTVTWNGATSPVYYLSIGQ
jgi:hypothetical protein